MSVTTAKGTTYFSAADAYQKAVNLLRINKRYNEGVRMMSEREADFRTHEEMWLAGIAMNPESRRYLDDELQSYWDAAAQAAPSLLSNRYNTVGEVVIGAGLHAAVYCAVRVLKGFRRPLVIDRAVRPGGAFAMSRKPSFYLNSSNRPGQLAATPREDGALNVLPGAPIQPSMISWGDFQANTDLAFPIRVMLAKYADVIPATEATSVKVNGTPTVMTNRGVRFYATRVIDARGLGDPRGDGETTHTFDGRQVLSFPQLMARLDRPFPFRSVRKMAVIGDGDSARCAVEAVLGIGPGASMATVGLDYVEKVDWYGPDLPTTCEDWRSTIRGRYQRLGSYLKEGRNRVRVLNSPGAVMPAYDAALVNGRSYDLVVVAAGNQLNDLGPDSSVVDSVYNGGAVLAKQYGDYFFRIGPAADIDFSVEESLDGVATPRQNKVAIFRLAPRTAALAASLPRC